jgi:hypothetical protein
VKRANEAGRPAKEFVEPRAGPRRMRNRTARPGHRAGKARPTVWTACGKPYASPPTSKVGAGCLNWARPVLCGGRSAMSVPTATAPTGEGFGREAKENSQWPENDSSLNGDVSMGDSVGSLILIKPKPVAS